MIRKSVNRSKRISRRKNAQKAKVATKTIASPSFKSFGAIAKFAEKINAPTFFAQDSVKQNKFNKNGTETTSFSTQYIVPGLQATYMLIAGGLYMFLADDGV
eukprot:TRINITY_DN1473_c0_g1_i2.p1 TRINITY_DN1473_c0_g1~~TRINITY_DN1473_c0_g1_i2.p1  ORF type:complete len:102 (-),score=16.28 TRINITY_DN1473_c0_g1_i2:1115-1420(-)